MTVKPQLVPLKDLRKEEEEVGNIETPFRV